MIMYVRQHICAYVLSHFSCIWLFVTPWTVACHGIFQARILDWVSIPTSRASYWPRDLTLLSYISCIGRWVLYHYHHLGSQVWLLGLCDLIPGSQTHKVGWVIPVSLMRKLTTGKDSSYGAMKQPQWGLISWAASWSPRHVLLAL